MSSHSSLLLDIGGTNMRYAYANRKNMTDEKILSNISDENIVQLEIPTGNPLLINLNNHCKITAASYLDPVRSEKLPKI